MAEFRGMPALSACAFLVVGTEVSAISQSSLCIYQNVNSPYFTHKPTGEFYSLQHEIDTLT